jgi:hypothetical protein
MAMKYRYFDLLARVRSLPGSQRLRDPAHAPVEGLEADERRPAFVTSPRWG